MNSLRSIAVGLGIFVLVLFIIETIFSIFNDLLGFQFPFAIKYIEIILILLALILAGISTFRRKEVLR